MDIVNTFELLSRLKQIEPSGFQVATRMGLLTTTKAIYKAGSLFFLFDMSEDFVFEPDTGSTFAEFSEKYKTWRWKIEETIS